MARPVNEQCFDEFFRRDFSRLVAFLIKAGFEREVAQDAAAEAMECAFRQWHTLTNPPAWVRRAAYRIAMSQVCRDREGVARAIAGGWWKRADSDQAESIADWIVLIMVLDKLPHSQRLVFAWYLDGFSATEIALQLEMLPSTVRSTLRHARRRLKLELRKLGILKSNRIEGGAPSE